MTLVCTQAQGPRFQSLPASFTVRWALPQPLFILGPQKCTWAREVTEEETGGLLARTECQGQGYPASLTRLKAPMLWRCTANALGKLEELAGWPRAGLESWAQQAWSFLLII